MKIEENMLNSLTDKFSSKNPKTSDEYYWQHQQQLENSALTFQSLLTEDKNPYPRSISSVQSTRVAVPASKPLEKRAPDNTYDLNPTLPLQQAKSPINFEQNSYFIRPNQMENKAFNAQEKYSDTPLANRDCANKKTSALTLNKVECDPVKNHQLFIFNNEAEFSLNTTALDIQQINELIQLIKQWLTSKGIRLQHLRINGVQHD
ncbi:hypothetical protein [Legionella sp.]|uniref:hypothetical protein n=1 Tax=Legionella sp. TaxID=459 RepID=UPI0032207EBC